MGIIIDGKTLAKEKREELKKKVQELKDKEEIVPGLAIIRVGNDPASEIYVRNKLKACQEVGIHAVEQHFDENASEQEIIERIEFFNQEKSIDGILVQSPLPKNLNEKKIVSFILGSKDVDGFGINNLGHLLANQEQVLAATPLGILHLLEKYEIPIASKNVLVIGRSQIVGRPLAIMFLNRDATVTIAHSKTKNLKELTLQADILVSAVGRPHFITADMVKDGAVCIDVGINRENGHVIGDMDFDAIKEKASFITPVPGGVGPMTVATLLENVYELASTRKKEK